MPTIPSLKIPTRVPHPCGTQARLLRPAARPAAAAPCAATTTNQ